MSSKNFMSYEDAEEILGEYADAVNSLKSGLTNLADVPVYTTDSALITDFRGKHDYYKTIVMSDSTKTMALLNEVNEEKVYVVLVENQQMWRNHPNFYAFLQDEVWVGILNIGENSVSVSVCNKLVKSSDNNLTTTDKTVVGAINEVRSGLTNYENQNNINLEVPNRKNILPMVVSNFKSINTSGTWSGNSYTINGVTYIINTDASGNITSISAYGSRTESSATTRLILANNLVTADYVGKLLSGCPNIGGENYGELFAQAVGGSYSVLADDFGDTTGVSISASSYPMRVCISVGTSFNVAESNAVAFYPMIRPATITDATFAPYIPSVESRIEAVEANQMIKTSETVTLNSNGISRLSLTLSQGRIVYAVKVEGGNNAYLVLPYCTTVDGGVWAVKVVNPDDMSPIASAEVTIAYGYLP